MDVDLESKNSDDQLDALFGDDDENAEKEKHEASAKQRVPLSEQTDADFDQIFGDEETEEGEETVAKINIPDESSAMREELHEEFPQSNISGMTITTSHAMASDLEAACSMFKLPPQLRVQPEEPFDPVHTVDAELLQFGANPDLIDQVTCNRMLVTMRYRRNYQADKDGDVKYESNTRLVTWSNGSQSLVIGDEPLFEVLSQDISNTDHAFLFYRHPGCMESAGQVMHKLQLRPYDPRRFAGVVAPTSSNTSVAVTNPETNKVKFMSIDELPMEDPLTSHARLIALDQEKARTRRRQDILRQNLKSKRQQQGTSLSESFLEQDDNEDYYNDDDDEEDDLGGFIVNEEEEAEQQEAQDEEEGELSDNDDEVFALGKGTKTKASLKRRKK